MNSSVRLPARRATPLPPRLLALLAHPSLQAGGALLLAWGVSNFALPRLGLGVLELYLLQPLVWLALLGWGVWHWRRASPGATFPRPTELMVVGALLGGLHVAVWVLLGLVFGFGHSMLARAWGLVLLNLWYAGTRLAGFEFARWAVVRGLCGRSPWLALAVAWPLFALLSVAPSQYGQFGTFDSALPFVGRDLLPALAGNLLATYLALLGGPLPALLYRALPVLGEWVAPLLPQLSWLTAAFAGTLLPLASLWLLADYSLPGRPAQPPASAPPAKSKGDSPAAWLLVTVVAVTALWFNTGLFGFRPSLVSGYSMKPTFMAGDLVISRVVPLDSLHVGDIVRFQLNGVDVVHRITAITRGADGRSQFTTQGDNNNTTDAPVAAEQVRGKVVATLPKLGWPAVWLRMLLAQGMALAGGRTP